MKFGLFEVEMNTKLMCSVFLELFYGSSCTFCQKSSTRDDRKYFLYEVFKILDDFKQEEKSKFLLITL